MRISDWSSDVCSSDLRRLVVQTYQCILLGGSASFRPSGGNPRRDDALDLFVHRTRSPRLSIRSRKNVPWLRLKYSRGPSRPERTSGCRRYARSSLPLQPDRVTQPVCSTPGAARSEEHTSELQSLMRISYAVF